MAKQKPIINMSVSLSKDISKKIEQDSEDSIARALNAVGLQMENYAELKCPVDTGRLRNSITFATSDKQGMANNKGGKEMAKEGDYKMKGIPDKHSVCIGTNVEYAPAIELGHSKKAPDGFLGIAVKNHVEEYKKMIESFLNVNCI